MKLIPSERERVHAACVFMGMSYAVSNVLNKFALNTGINPLVFAAYRDIVALLSLLVAAYFFERGKRPPSYVFVIKWCLALGLTGVFGFQLLYLIGLSLTSVHLATSVAVTIPVFTVVIAAIFRTEKIGLLKAAGVALSVGGYAIITLFRGPLLFSAGNENGDSRMDWNDGGVAAKNNGSYSLLWLSKWQVGSCLLLGAAICSAAHVNIQVPLLARFPAPVTTTTISYTVGTIMILLFSWFNIEHSSNWNLKNKMEIIAIVYTGLISSSLNIVLQAWCIHKAGPLLVISYTPLMPIFSTILGIIFLRESLHLGSVLGATLIMLGLYLVIWVQKEHISCKNSLIQSNRTSSVDDSQLPLLEDG